jgi:hypothetical protein
MSRCIFMPPYLKNTMSLFSVLPRARQQQGSMTAR